VRVSQHYKLNRTQAVLDFVDVDIACDIPVFVDPHALRLFRTEWGEECIHLVRSFFEHILGCIKEGKHDRAKRLLSELREPNEVHLGLSKGKSRGRALGKESAVKVWDALQRSEAVRSNLLEDLEDSILLIEGISSDIISDITVNLIRGPLIEYTARCCDHYGIPMKDGVDSGPLWDAEECQWHQEYVQLPVAKGLRLMLVPKVIVRRKLEYDSDEYYRNYILEYLRSQELSANSELVQLLKNGKKRITNKELSQKYGKGKGFIVAQTLLHPELLARYRQFKGRSPQSALTHEGLAELKGGKAVDWPALIGRIDGIVPGKEDAGDFEKAIEEIMSALFYPSLVWPKVQVDLHEGRKRVDITYSNAASAGFFRWLSLNYQAPYIFIECKNYSKDLGNPELDQIQGRFSPNRGKVGIIVCRSFQDKALFLKRCKDTAQDQRGFILALDDADVKALTAEVKNGSQEFTILKEQFQALVM
jgi:hypothetical protein